MSFKTSDPFFLNGFCFMIFGIHFQGFLMVFASSFLPAASNDLP